MDGRYYGCSVAETSNGSYIVGAYGTGDYYDSTYESLMLKILVQNGAPEVQELVVENSRKEFKITTSVTPLQGPSGGNISGQYESAYEVVKYGDNSTKEIVMTPYVDYEIVGVTVNGKEHAFTANEDGSYTMPMFTNVIEDKKVIVTYSLKDNKIIINKIDSETKVGLEGATFRLDEIEEREQPQNIIGPLTDNGQEYIEADLEKELQGVIGELTDNGIEYGVTLDKTKEATDVLGDLTNNGQLYTTTSVTKEITDVLNKIENNGTYYFVEQDGKYVPTNSKTYQGTGKGGTTANSYITIDLSDKEGNYAVVVNANCSSESGWDIGYATITESTSAPTYSYSTGRFINISGTVDDQDYTSMTLDGGKIYYLHLGYKKDGSVDRGTDQIIFNSIKLYEAKTVTKTYNFIENQGKYESNNQGQSSTVANSYIPIDLTNKTGTYAVVANANISSESQYDIGYATITEDTIRPEYNNSTGRFMYIYGTSEAQDYTSMSLKGGKTYYLHLGYKKNESTDVGDDKFTVNSIKIYEADAINYEFVEKEGKYESNNQGQSGTVANSYISIDLSGKTGTHAVVVNANVSSEKNYEYGYVCDYGYAQVTENTARPSNNSGFIYISGTDKAVTDPKDYTVLLSGGKVYYLHFGYYKNYDVDSGDDKFTINSVKVYKTKTVAYNFIQKDDKYESSNQGRDERVSNSYIPIDLTNYEGRYNLIVNANISSEGDGDYGYATITKYTSRPAYSDGSGRFIYISGTAKGATTPTDYTTVLQGGYLYYLHFGYYKNTSLSEGEDKFTINSVKVVTNGDYLYHTELTTNSEGKAMSQVPFKKYAITEVVAPEGYELNENATIIDFTADGNHEFTFENNKLAKVIVHHYIKGTTTKVAEDDILQDKAGYPYRAVPKLDLEKYELETAEDGSYIIPENATGQFVSGEREVIYYYIEKDIPLIVNHYIEGTETPVSLLGGEDAESITTYGIAGNEYSTEAISVSQLGAEYELVEVPSNSVGKYEGDRVEVTYYYKKVVRNLTINKYQEDGVTPLEGATFTIQNKNENVIRTEEMKNNGTYYFEDRGGYYVSNNMYIHSTVANSYIKIDLTRFRETVDLTVTASVLSENNDYGYATITESTTAPSHDASEGRFIYISGYSNEVTTSTDYTTVLEGGKIYYLHLGYYKDDYIFTGTDRFTINSIKLNGKEYTEYINNGSSEYTTNSQGKIETTLEAGEYIITEVQAPAGYQLPDEATQEIVISKTFGDISLDITNKKEQGKVIVHYYIENSTVPVLLADGTQALDIVKTGAIGEIYATKALDNVDSKFELIREPSNASGTITREDTEVTYYYKKPSIEEKMTVEKKATDEITTTETKVYYEVKFAATLNYFDGNAKITLVDTLPYSIDAEESELAGGTYDEETRTITWVEEINNLEVLINDMMIERTKILNLKYNYGDINETTGKMENKVNAKLELFEPSESNPNEYVLVKEDNQEATAETLIKVPAQVVTHHYIYDAEKDEYTTIELTGDETIEGIIGAEYKAVPSTKVPGNYSCINVTPEKHEGKMTQEVIEVTFYYQLMPSTVESTINKIAKANKEDGNKIAILTKEDGVVTYDIKYNISIKDYIGKATVEIVDTLPAEIDAEKSELANGIYEKETNTITWTEEIKGIDTYANGTFTTVVTKQIKVVYKNQDLTNHIVNTVEGKVKTYYPESHTTNAGQEIIASIARDNEAVMQEYKANIQVEKQWEDNNDLKGKRPESVTVVISGIPNEEPIEKILNAENEWKCEITDLPKYDAQGNKIVYEVTEKQTEVGDLEYYELPTIINVEGQTEDTTNYMFIVKNVYKLLNTDLKAEIFKTGTEEITSSNQEVEYTINFKAEIIEYIGAGKVKIVDTLPYKIDESKSDLANGIYDDITQTITWVEELSHINTEVSGKNHEENITKQIKVVYKDIDLVAEKMTNKVNGKIELYESEVKDEKEATYDTKVNVEGKVIVNYINIDTGEHIDKNYTYEISKKVGSTYTAEKKEIDNYEYVKSTNNETGIITAEIQEVNYYYTRTKASVLVKYQDVEGNELLPDVSINGQVLDEYMTEEKQIENYRIVSVTDNKQGIMTKEQIVVIYVYERIPSKVIVKYIYKDIQTGEEKELLPEETIEGLAGDEYITERKVITNYRAAEPEPTNKNGKIAPDPIEVIYYYEKIPSGIITVKYVEIETEEEIAYKTETEQTTYKEEIKGFIGDEYKTEEKEIPYYVFVKNTENATGILTEKGDTVTYYYRKQILDFSIEKTIKEISLNGSNVRVPNDKLAKIEVRKQEIEETEIVITYEIAVKNEGEIRGTAIITEIVPEGYEVIEKEERWQENEGVLETEVELDVGEKEELTIKQKWISGSENLGDKTNNVQISKIENEPNFEDTTVVNNISSAGIIVSVNSGGKIDNGLQIMLPIILLTSIYAASVLIITIKKERLKNR